MQPMLPVAPLKSPAIQKGHAQPHISTLSVHCACLYRCQCRSLRHYLTVYCIVRLRQRYMKPGTVWLGKHIVRASNKPRAVSLWVVTCWVRCLVIHCWSRLPCRLLAAASALHGGGRSCVFMSHKQIAIKIAKCRCVHTQFVGDNHGCRRPE